ncbi:MAG: response regulator transcription factor [Syntrophomonadaceae bacterium]|nr:response regulator transcription factor [Syntrophomonadaceae bacterium]
MKHEILVVEDQKEISDIVVKYLDNEGYGFHVSKDGFEALEYISSNKVNLVILDVMMPGIDGFDVLKEIRKSSEVPVIMLTAKQEELDRIKGFDIGADDYVAKPFSPRELMQRIKVIIKRIYHDSDEIVYRYKNLSLYTNSKKLYRKDQELVITSTEYELLLAMFRNQGQVLSREQLINYAYGQEYEGYDRNIDSYVKRIRYKIEEDPKNPKVLITKYGAGYLFGGDEV